MDSLFYVLLPTLATGVCLGLLLRGAKNMTFPFSGMSSVPFKELERKLDERVYVIFAVLIGGSVALTMVDIAFWPDSIRHVWLSAGLWLAYAVPLWLFWRGTLPDHFVCACITSTAHVLFIMVASTVSGGHIATVVMENFAIVAVFPVFATMGNEALALGQLVVLSLFLMVADTGVLNLFSHDPWFDLASMERQSRFLPVTIALSVLAQMASRRIAGLYRAKRLEHHFAELDRQKDEFLRSVTHEIKSPLNGIIGCSELLSDSTTNALSQEQQDLLSVIRHSSAALNLLVDNVLSQSHSALSADSVVWEVVALDPFFQSTFMLLKNLVYQSSIEFVLKLDKLPKCARIPRLMLTQVILNLGLNAVKHAGAGQNVTLWVTRTEAGKLLCEVQDRGPGISDEADVFSSQRPVKRSSTTGTGLGLRICRKLVECMGGRIGYRPNGFKGSVFFVIIPVVFDEVEEVGVPFEEDRCASKAKDDLHLAEGFDVLVVDDARVNLKVLEGLLVKHVGLSKERVSCVVDGWSALSILIARRNTPIVVFMDICMPELDGNACVHLWNGIEKEMRTCAPRYFVACTAGHQSIINISSFHSIMTKPIQSHLLKEAVSSGAKFISQFKQPVG